MTHEVFLPYIYRAVPVGFGHSSLDHAASMINVSKIVSVIQSLAECKNVRIQSRDAELRVRGKSGDYTVAKAVLDIVFEVRGGFHNKVDLALQELRIKGFSMHRWCSAAGEVMKLLGHAARVEDEGVIVWDTRANGDAQNSMHSPVDMDKACSHRAAIEGRYPGALVEVSTCDEWVILSVAIHELERAECASAAQMAPSVAQAELPELLAAPTPAS